MLSPDVCGPTQSVQAVGLMCGVTQMAAAILAKTLGEEAAEE